MGIDGLVFKFSKVWPGVAALALVAIGLAAPSRASAACTGTLAGSYGVTVSGATTQGVGKFLTGVLSFNSACVVTGDISIGENNTVTGFASLAAGSYATNADGSVTLSLILQPGSAPELYAIGFTPAFNEAVGVETDTSAVASIDLKPQTPPGGTAITGYNNAILKGAFVASCSGISGTYTDLNDFTFDGTSTGGIGNITAGVDYFNNFGQSGVEPYTGQYAVNADGTFTGGVSVAGTSYGITGVVDNGGNEVQFVYSLNNADVTACSAKRVIAPVVTVTPSKYFACHVAYAVTSQSGALFTAAVTISNTGNTPVSSWNVGWTYANGQVLLAARNARPAQFGASVTLTGSTSLAGGSSAPVVTLTGLWNTKTNAVPTTFNVNGVSCS